MYKKLLLLVSFVFILPIVFFSSNANAEACSWTKSGNKVCARDLNALYKMVPAAQFRQETTTVNGKLVNPAKPIIKDAPYTAAGNQKIGEPSNIVRQTGKTGTKSSFDIAKDKQIAAENFRKQQEAAELNRQRNIKTPNKNCTIVKDKRTGKTTCVYPETGVAR